MSAFRYPAAPHERRHGPQGYATYESYRPWLRDEFSFRCTYCLLREQWGLIRGGFELDHFRPAIADPDRALEYDNLLYACASCNAAKSSRIVPDPGVVFIDQDVVVEDNGQIFARTPGAARLIEALALNSEDNVELRRLWIDIVALAVRYDTDLHRRLMAYPDKLPDLARLRPPGGNSRPEGVAQSHFALRELGNLDPTY